MPSTNSDTPSAHAFLLASLEKLAVLIVKPIKWLVRGYLPYGHYMIDSTARFAAYLAASVPILASFLYVASLTAGGPSVLTDSLTQSVTVLKEWKALIIANSHYTALAFAIYYFATGVLTYEPHDKHAKDYRRRNVIEPPYEWEGLIADLISVSTVSFTFSIAYFHPAAVTVIPGDLLGLVAGGVILATIPYVASRRMFTARWEGDEENPRVLGHIKWYSSAIMRMWAGILFAIATGIPSGIIGMTELELLFLVNFLAMGYLARHLRWTYYQDRDGLINIRPHIRLWGAVSRVPLAYAAAIVVLEGVDGMMTQEFIVFGTFAPLAATLGYLAFRFVRTNQDMYRAVLRVGDHRDDYDVMEDLRGNSPYLNFEQSQALLPENQLETELNRVQHRLKEVKREASARGYDVMELKPIMQLTTDADDSYNSRSRRLASLSNGLRRLEREVEDDLPKGQSDDLLDDIDAARDSIEEAKRRNREVGNSRTEKMKDALSK
jgi:uncharacterized protein (UPF0335 family)